MTTKHIIDHEQTRTLLDDGTIEGVRVPYGSIVIELRENGFVGYVTGDQYLTGEVETPEAALAEIKMNFKVVDPETSK